MAVFLGEIIDGSYEPSEEEILEYAEWLGMNLEDDGELLWIARASLKALLPVDWKPCQTEEGDIFFFNVRTQDSVWDHPCDEHYRTMYHHEKAKMNAPVRVLTISGCFTAKDTLTVTCVGTLSGEELGVYKVRPSIKVQGFRAGLAKRLEISKRQVQILVPDGGLLSEEDDQCLLADALDLEAPVGIKEEEMVSKEVAEEMVSKEEMQTKPQNPEAKAVTNQAQNPEAKSVIEEMQFENPEQWETRDSEQKEAADLDLNMIATQLSLSAELSVPFQEEEASGGKSRRCSLRRRPTIESLDPPQHVFDSRADDTMCEAVLKPLASDSLVTLGCKRGFLSSVVKDAGDDRSDYALSDPIVVGKHEML